MLGAEACKKATLSYGALADGVEPATKSRRTVLRSSRRCRYSQTNETLSFKKK